jgi:hypothetical protein
MARKMTYIPEKRKKLWFFNRRLLQSPPVFALQNAYVISM